MGEIIVAHEKHGESYWPASTPEEKAASALAILTERWNQGYWYHDPDEISEWALEHHPEEFIEILLADVWPGNDAPLEAKQAAVAVHKAGLQERYGDDQEVLDLKLRKLKKATDEWKVRNRERQAYQEIRRVVEEQDLGDYIYETRGGDTRNGGPIAWRLLSDRSDHEYERVSLEQLQEATS